MTKQMPRYPPSVVLEDLSSLEDESLCSSTSTITCSVWSSMSNLDRSSIRQISSQTFSGIMDDDEYHLGGGGRGGGSRDDDAADNHHHEGRRKSTKNMIDQVFGHSSKTAADPLMLSERSLFQEPLSPIRRNDAPKAPARPQDDGSSSSHHNEDNHRRPPSSRPQFMKASSCPLSLGNTLCAADSSITDRNSFRSLRGIDLKPEIPTRSRYDWNDDSSDEVPIDDHGLASNLDERAPRAHRKQLMKRIDHIHRMLADDDCKILQGASSLSDRLRQEEPPKVPRRGLFIEQQSKDHSSVVASSPPFKNFHPALQKVHAARDDDTCKSEKNESPAKASSRCYPFDKKSRMTLPPTKPRRKKRMTKTHDHHSRDCNASTIPREEQATRETPPLLTKVSKSDRDLLPRRSRSKTPPKRFATAPAVLRYNSDSEEYPIPKRIIKRNRSSEHPRRRGQVLNNSSLASILESDDENLMASFRNSPPRVGQGKWRLLSLPRE